MIIKDILRRLMVEKGVSVSDISRDTGIAYRAIQNILNGFTKNPYNETVKKLADYFEVPPSYLLGEGERRPTIAERKAALEKQLEAYATWPPPPGGVPVDVKKTLYEKYLKAGLVSFRLEELDAEGVEMVYKLLLKVEGEESERERTENSGEGSRGT